VISPNVLTLIGDGITKQLQDVDEEEQMSWVYKPHLVIETNTQRYAIWRIR
jgi:cephalosporin hydroxylase